MSKAIAKKDPMAQMTGFRTVSIKELDEETKNVLKDSVAKGTTDTELAYFLNVALAQELNPFAKEVWCIKRASKDANGKYDYTNAPLLIMTSRDGFLKMAKRDPVFDYIQSAEVREGDQFTIDAVNGKVEHRFTTKRGQILGAYAIITRKDGAKIAKYVTWSEYHKESPIWKTNPTAMICKCAEAVLCRQFANVSSIQSEETMDRNGNIIDGSPEVALEQGQLKNELIDRINACDSYEALEALKTPLASDLGKLFEDEKKEVMNAAIVKSMELKAKLSSELDATAVKEEKPKRGRPKKEEVTDMDVEQAEAMAQQDGMPM